MSVSYEAFGPGGHEKFAEEIFGKIHDLPKLETVELTKEQYDALTPEQKADPNKLYLVPGSGSYPKFVEISAEEYESLTDEEKNDPSVVYFTPGTGTYFRVIDISAEDYENLTEEEKMDPQVLYLISDDTEYLTTTDAASTYLSKSDAAETYAKPQDIPDVSGFETSSHAAATYATKSEVQAEAASKSVPSTMTITDGVDGAILNKCIIHVLPDTGSGPLRPTPSDYRIINGHSRNNIRVGAELNGSSYTNYRINYNKAIAAVQTNFPNFDKSRYGTVMYGGYYDAIEGTFTITQIKYTFDGTETLTVIDRSVGGNRYSEFRFLFDDDYFVNTTIDDDPSLICSHYKTVRDDIHQDINSSYWCTIQESTVAFDGVAGRSVFIWRHNEILSKNDMLAYFDDQYTDYSKLPVDFVATLKEPIVVENVGVLDIRTLGGNNAFWLYLDDTSTLDIEYLTSSVTGAFKQVENKEVIVNLTWDATNNWYTSDKLLIGHTNLYPNAIINLVLEQGYDAEFRIDTGDTTSLPNFKHRRLLIPFEYHRNDTNIVNSYILFYSYDAGATSGLTLKRYRAQYESSEDMYVIKEESI